MSTELEKTIRELKDRQEIHDCMLRYCRGLDRYDRELLASAYHPDAMDDHGFYVGPVEEFIELVFPLHEKMFQTTQHHISNHTCEIDGDTAHTETYFTFMGLNKAAPYFVSSTGRYLDRLERRNGKWAIAARVCITETQGNRDDLSFLKNFISPQPNRTDASYQRPLNVDPARMKK